MPSHHSHHHHWVARGLLGFLIIAALTVATAGRISEVWASTTYSDAMSSPTELMNARNVGVTLLDRNGQPFFIFDDPNRKQFVPLSEMTDTLPKALIASEDKEFYDHHGYSIGAMLHSLLLDLKAQRIVRGGSTITAQLVKLTLLSPDRSYIRKYQELILATQLEKRYSKDQILEMYLNTAYFGDGAYGAEMAAKTIFGKSAHELTVAQSALLVGLLPAPSTRSPLSGDREAAIHFQHEVLSAMQEQGMLTEEQRLAAAAEELQFQSAPELASMNTQALHFAFMVRQALIDHFGEAELAHSGLTVTTTLDPDAQRFAETTLAEGVKKLAAHAVSNGAVVVEDPRTGEIRAVVGSVDYQREGFGNFNAATALRQPGSSFKPLVYGLAFQNRVITPATMLHDQPITYSDPWGNRYAPRNYDNRFRGRVSARRALANSFNIPAVEVMNKLSVPSVIEYAKAFGITTLEEPDRYGLSLVLGAAEVPLVQMTNAYATYANQGTYHDPVLVLKIHDKFGQPVDWPAPATRQAVSSQVAYQVTSILADNAIRKEIFGSALTISRPAAAKTGTTNDYKDAWTLGYTPDLAVGVWVGNNDGRPMDQIAGALGPAPIWRTLMEHYLANQPVANFSQPDGLVAERICPWNGLKAPGGIISAYSDYFLPGTEPTGVCTIPTPPTPGEEKKEPEKAIAEQPSDEKNKPDKKD